LFLGFFVLKLCVLRIALCLWEFLNPEEDDDDDDDFILLFYFLIYKLWFSFLEVCLLSRVCIELKIIFCCWKVPLSMCFFLPVKLIFYVFFFPPPPSQTSSQKLSLASFFPSSWFNGSAFARLYLQALLLSTRRIISGFNIFWPSLRFKETEFQESYKPCPFLWVYLNCALL
jgi:hypothetical protein